MTVTNQIHKVAKLCVFAEHDGEFFVLLINEKRWSFPGGKLEPGETEIVALAREVIEECNSLLMDELVRQSVYVPDVKPVALFLRMVPWDHLILCASTINSGYASLVCTLDEMEIRTDGFWKTKVVFSNIRRYFCCHRSTAFHECIYPDCEDDCRLSAGKRHCSFVPKSIGCSTLRGSNGEPQTLISPQVLLERKKVILGNLNLGFEDAEGDI